MEIRESQGEKMPGWSSPGELSDMGALSCGRREKEFAERVRTNQHRLRSQLKTHYDFIICGSGSSGSLIAGRLASEE